MNWLLPAVAVFLILAAWDGHRKGFIKKMVGIVSLALTLVLTSVVSPLVAEFLKNSTGLYSTLQNSILSSDAELLETLGALGLGDAVSGYLAEQILHAVAFLITLLLAGVLVQGIALSLGLAARLPVLHGINRENAGRYRSVPVMISGSRHIQPQPYLIEKQMEDIAVQVDNIQKEIDKKEARLFAGKKERLTFAFVMARKNVRFFLAILFLCLTPSILALYI